MHEYDLNGNFNKRISLPTLSASYTSFKYVNSDLIIFWTFEYQNRVKFYSLSKNKVINETFPEEDNILNHFLLIFPYGNFLYRPISNTVFGYTLNCEIVSSYTWDFGSLNNDVTKLNKFNDLLSEMTEETLMKKMFSSEIVNYLFANQGGNSTYYMAQLYRKNKILNILHNKLTKENYVFDKTIENARFYPFYWTEDYVIGRKLETEKNLDICLPDEVLDEKNRAIKNEINEFDNPVLIKYYFKKD